MDERIDLTALEADEAQRELMVAAVMLRARGELERRGGEDVSPIAVLSDWMRPALAAAAVIAAVCMSVLTQRELAHVEPGTGLTDALEVPAPMNEWLISDRSPTVADLLIAMDRGAN
ncbi:MAG TPA: hypothetical protein VHG09_15375 [Longimicrobiales bacterium]|nr:hypothetical protein [Longimicrobiales bacterium]